MMGMVWSCSRRVGLMAGVVAAVPGPVAAAAAGGVVALLHP